MRLLTLTWRNLLLVECLISFIWPNLIELLCLSSNLKVQFLLIWKIVERSSWWKVLLWEVRLHVQVRKLRNLLHIKLVHQQLLIVHLLVMLRWSLRYLLVSCSSYRMIGMLSCFEVRETDVLLAICFDHSVTVGLILILVH